MLGAIIGDIVGSRWEFNPTNDYDFEWLSGENGFTDDISKIAFLLLVMVMREQQ